MSAPYPHTRSGLPGVPRMLALPLILTFACSDGTDPVEPSKHPAGPSGTASFGAYPGTTNTEFSKVQFQGEAMAISIKFDYTGSVTPAFTVGTTHNVLGSQVISVAAKKQAAGYWTATAKGLDSHKKYYFRLDNLKSTWYDSAKTLSRDVAIDLDSIYVENDSDPGPGCGEWRVEAIFPSDDFGERIWRIGALDHSFCSGTTYKFDGKGLQDGYLTQYGVPMNFYLYFNVKEQDDCWPYDTVCYETNSTSWWGAYLRYSYVLYQSGTYKFDQSLETVARPRARFWGKLQVSYNPW